MSSYSAPMTKDALLMKSARWLVLKTQKQVQPPNFSQGLWRGYQGIFTFVQPIDLDLYRALLPPPFAMPKQPLVLLYVLDYFATKMPILPYQESAIALVARYKGIEGVYILDMPLNRRVPMWAGQMMGLPKHLIPNITLTKTTDGWRGEEKCLNGSTKLLLNYSLGVNRSLDIWELPLVSTIDNRLKQFRGYTLIADSASAVNQLAVKTLLPTVSFEDCIGTVSIELADDLPWRDLLPDNLQSCLGIFHRYEGGFNFVTECLA